jgi:hypothetical protein
VAERGERECGEIERDARQLSNHPAFVFCGVLTSRSSEEEPAFQPNDVRRISENAAEVAEN